jgi:phosphoribosylamine--glycine ligase
VKVLVVGSGGREHALAWKLSASSSLTELHAAPGNPGIATLGYCHPVAVDDSEGLLALARSLGADLVLVGPEAPLVAGVADELRHAGIPVFGPARAAAAIEGSKGFAKDVMAAAGVPTAATLSVARPPCVVKADGLAAGKGVFVCRTQEELDAGLVGAAAFGGGLVIEELLEGPEVSLLALCDGGKAIPLAPAQDFKRAFDGDEGPNTGGMGAYAPVPGISEDEARELLEQVHRPVLAELARRGMPFVGCLYAGLMLTAAGPRVLEFNCRFGDPETQVLAPLVEGDMLEAIAAAAAGELEGVALARGGGAAVGVVLAAGEYPAGTARGSEINGIEAASASGALVFHAGTALRDGQVTTNGGRVLNVVGRGATLASARDSAYGAAALISFPGVRYRNDIGELAAAGFTVSTSG